MPGPPGSASPTHRGHPPGQVTGAAVGPGRAPSRAHGLSWLLAGLVAGLSAGFLFLLFHDWAFDDPFITFRYSANLVDGIGFVYNPGQPILSTTAPLYALLLAVPYWLGIPLVTAANLVGAVSLGLGGLALWQLGRLWLDDRAGWAWLLLYPWAPLLAGTLGGEAPLYLALALGSLTCYGSRRYVGSAVLISLAVLTRADALLLGLLMAGHFLLFRRAAAKEAIPWGALAIALAIVALASGWAWRYFGSPLPVTLSAKRHQGLMAISQSFPRGFFPTFAVYGIRPWLWLFPGMLALGLARPLLSPLRTDRLRQWQWLLLPLWSAVYFLAYSGLGVTSYFWYYAPLIPGLVALVGVGAVTAGDLMSGILDRRPGAGTALIALLLLALFLSQAATTVEWSRTRDARIPLYQATGLWLAENTPPAATVAALEVGAIGYYGRRPMIDFAGLIQPAVAEQITAQSTYEDTAAWALESYRPDFVIVQPVRLPALLQNPLLLDNCQPVHTVVVPSGTESLEIWSCRWP